ncbi:MAG TPA: GAF domain-containing protein [Dermatophilaceae bacterium]|jgi:hypothetical protein
MPRTSPIRRWALVAVIAVVAAAVAYYIQVQVPDIAKDVQIRWGPFDAPKRSVWTWAGVCLAGMAVGLPLLEGTRSARAATAARVEAVDAEARRQEVINGVLSPFASLLGEIADLDRRAGSARARLQGEAKTVVLAGLTDLLGGAAKVRATYFQLEDGPPRGLVEKGTYGRPDTPRRAFLAGEAAGDAALSAVDQGQARYWREDVDALPAGWTGPKAYRTFISAPVATKGHLLGMLTVDAPDPDDFTEGDVPSVTLLARLLAAALNE